MEPGRAAGDAGLRPAPTSDSGSPVATLLAQLRRMLGCDAAAVALKRIDGVSHVPFADGMSQAVSSAFEIPPRTGIADAAQAGGKPMWTSDYLADDRFVHSPRLDEAVRADGVRAVIAAPLLRDGAAIGVLYGVCRHSRRFTPAEVDLCTALARVAVVLLDHTMRLQRMHAERAELEGENGRLHVTLLRSRHLAEAHGRLTDMVLGGSDLSAVVNVAADALDGTLLVRDPGGAVLAATGAVPELEDISARAKWAGAHAARTAVPLADGVWAVPVTAGAEELGTVVLKNSGQLGEFDARFLWAVAQSVALILVLERDTAVVERPLRDELFEDLLSGSVSSPRHLAERALRIGIDPDGPHVVLVLRPEGGEQGKAIVWASSYAYRKGGLRSPRGEYISMLLPGSDPSAVARAVSRDLSSVLGHPVSVGAAGPGAGLASTARLHREALRCLKALIALDRVGSTASAEDLGFVGLLLSEERDVAAFIESALGPVLCYDSERRTELIRTLGVYFAADRSPTRAAEELHVHVNTVSRRLERIGRLLGPTWREPERTLEIQLALQLLRTQDTLRQGDAAPLGPGPARR
ncbi:GAF domain-containing protein [Streptomyces synnematoformans]|uniref:GAF domain-containing protein n=1 Tax=Streptomyces synnematoformans TaxID=415721 RepID=A0ABN2Z5C6_9ACTN